MFNYLYFTIYFISKNNFTNANFVPEAEKGIFDRDKLFFIRHCTAILSGVRKYNIHFHYTLKKSNNEPNQPTNDTHNFHYIRRKEQLSFAHCGTLQCGEQRTGF